MEHFPTISIVTPSFNQGEFIEATIQSVISQEGNFFIDYIIMDGGSTDNTVEIIKKYEQLLNNKDWPVKCKGIKLRWLSEEDKGQTHAINKGLKIAEGEIVSYINSDDMYYKDAITIVTEYFSENLKDDFVYGDGDVVDENGNLLWEWLSRPYNFSLMKSYHYLWNDFTNYIMQQATFWRADVLNKIGLLDESFHYAMDVEYWIRAGAAGLKLKHIPVKLGEFRMIKGTKSLSNPTVFWPDMLEIFRKYNGHHRMAPFFSYFFYNVAQNCGYDMHKAWQERANIFTRWNKLSNEEKKILEKKAQQGFERACLISMNKAYNEDNKHTALIIFHHILKRNFLLVLHPLTLIFITKYILGKTISNKLNKLKEMCITFYRQRKYQYRYLQKDKGL